MTPIDDEFPLSGVPDIRTAIEFIKQVETATLASQFDPEGLEELLNPMEHSVVYPNDPGFRASIQNYLALIGCSQNRYEAVRKNMQELAPDQQFLSHYQAERRAQKFSGIITWEHHMCVKSCVGFTGPYTNLDACPRCGEPRYNQKDLEDSGGERKVPRNVFTTFPVGPQLQARWNNPQTARDMCYRRERTEELLREHAVPGQPPEPYDDILCGKAYLDLVDEGEIGENDTVLMLSFDGAQLYKSKDSNCWIYIWILVDLAPDKRYKIRNILPGGVIPGPNSPDDLDSFLFPGLAHISALQKEGLPIWNSYHGERTVSFLFLLLVLADSVAMAKVSGSVGHHGRKGCRMLCGLIGRNKPQGPHYYPALLKPTGFDNHPTSAHDDIDVHTLPVPSPTEYKKDLFYVVASRNENSYKDRRFDTGISKPSIVAGIPRILPLPTCFAGDLMHQPLLNLATLFIDLWCARPKVRDYDRSSSWPWAVLTGDTWVKHGEVVAQAAKYLPTSFGQAPRNPHLKISSSYKAWEWLTYIYGLGPGVFYEVLPDEYYSHLCLLVRAIRIIHQRTISEEQMVLAHRLLLQWTFDFETYYCNRKPERLHFVRQCVHSVTHLARETHRLGPLWLSSQWTMERVIGHLGSLLSQPSNPFRNLAAQTRRVATTNALVAIWPDLEKKKGDPQGSKDLGDNYLLLGPKDTSPHQIPPNEWPTFEAFFSGYAGLENINHHAIYRWGRLRLPTEQIARSRWKEMERCSDMARTDRNLKVRGLI